MQAEEQPENDLPAPARPKPDAPESVEPEAASAVPSIRLDDFLKLSGLVGTGGQAKRIIQGGEVLVNGELETRRRRQLREGDVVEWNGATIEVERN